MANEVIIEEYGEFRAKTNSGEYVSIPGPLITSQVINAGSLSAQLDARTLFVRIMAPTTGFWYKLGTSAASAAANTAGNRWCPANGFVDVSLALSDTHIDTAI